MIKKALILRNLAEGQIPCSVHSPSPGTLEGDELLINERGAKGDTWNNFIVDLTGRGRLFSFRCNEVKETTVFTSTASESVLVLRLQMLNESYTHFPDKGSKSILWPEKSCYLFWMDSPLEDQLFPGKHIHCDILFRMDSLGALFENQIIKNLIERIPHFGNDLENPINSKMSLSLHNLIMETMLPEITNKSLTLERFSYLCDCILLLCCGEEVDVKPISAMPITCNSLGITNIEEDLFEEEELIYLARLKKLSKEQLVRKFKYLRKRVSKLRDSWTEVSETRDTLRRLCAEERYTQRSLLADAYLKYAQFFEAMYWKTDAFTNEEKELIIDINKECLKNSGWLSMPARKVDEDFYVDWEAFSNSPKETIGSDLWSVVSSSKIINHDKSDIDNKRARFGYMPMSLFREKEKPKELVDIYQRLMNHLSDTLTLMEGEGVESSDDISLVEGVYEFDDYIMLLRLDSLYLGGDSAYVSSLNETRLSHLILALEDERMELSGLVRIVTKKTYSFQLYNSMEGDLTKVKDRMLLDIVDFNMRINNLLVSMKKMYKKASSKEVMEAVHAVKDLYNLYLAGLS